MKESIPSLRSNGYLSGLIFMVFLKIESRLKDSEKERMLVLSIGGDGSLPLSPPLDFKEDADPQVLGGVTTRRPEEEDDLDEEGVHGQRQWGQAGEESEETNREHPREGTPEEGVGKESEEMAEECGREPEMISFPGLSSHILREIETMK